MTRLLTVAVISLFISKDITAQAPSQITTAKIKDIMAGIRNTTYVVLYDPVESEASVVYEKIVGDTVVQAADKQSQLVDDHPYNEAIKEAMKLWKLGKYEFIRESEFEEKRMDPTNSFIFPVQVRENLFNQRIESTYLVFAIGSPRGSRAMRLPRIASIPLAYNNVSADVYAWKLPGLIQFLQAHTEYVSALSSVTDEEIIKHYHGKASQVKDYTLYVLQEDLTADIYTEEKIKEIYPGDVKIVNQDEMRSLIMKKDPNGAFLHKAGPERMVLEDALCRKYVITMNGGECIYMAEDEIKKKSPEGLLESDLKRFKK